MEGMGRLQFSDLFTELPVPPQKAGVVLKKLYIILSTTVSFLDLKDDILFLQGLLVFYISIFLPSTLKCFTSFDGFI